MKAIISVVGRFHAFDLAKQLKRNGILYKLNTTYPSVIARKWGLTNPEIQSNAWLEIISRIFPRLGWTGLGHRIVYSRQARSNCKLLGKADALISWSGASLEAFIKAKQLGKITILERGSSHYSYQVKILTEEYLRYGKEYLPNYYAWQRELLEYELADIISVPSTYVKNTFLEQGVPVEKLWVNPYGVDLSHFKPVPKKDKVFRIIVAGSLSIRKGARYALEAFSELNLPDAELWHLGSVHPDFEPFLPQYNHPNIRLLGHQPQERLYEFYSQGSVFVMMSLEEGMAMVQLQAMACGLPLICTTNTGGSDLISEDGAEGYVIAIRDTERLKTLLLELYQDPSKGKTMGERAQKRVGKGYTWEEYGDRYARNLSSL